MDKKIKLAVLALLGFSTACSTVKKAARSESEVQTTVVMYGLRAPDPEPEKECVKMEHTASPEAQATAEDIQTK